MGLKYEKKELSRHVKMKIFLKRLINKVTLLNFMPKTVIFFCVLALTGLCLITIYFDVIIEASFFKKSLVPIAQLNESTKFILYWNKLFGDDSFYLGHGDICSVCDDVPSGLTYASPNREIKNIDDYDVIMFHGSELDIYDLPEKRNIKQRYVYVNLESPINRPLPDSLFENFFNLTMTYRLDSDIVFPYNEIYEKNGGSIVAPLKNTIWKSFENVTDSKSQNAFKWIRRKNKTAVWFVSNCQSAGGREKYVDELSKHIDVDIFGKCGSEIKCPPKENCFEKIVEPDYFFYLSFENSLCQDYVTEKLFTALKYNVVPIVYGGANYSLFAPPNSYINAMDFNSPKSLANYLRKLIKNPAEYKNYFKWKKHYELSKQFNFSARCQLCKLLHDNNHQRKSYNSLSAWYSNGKCPLQEKLGDSIPYLTKLTVN